LVAGGRAMFTGSKEELSHRLFRLASQRGCNVYSRSEEIYEWALFVRELLSSWTSARITCQRCCPPRASLSLARRPHLWRMGYLLAHMVAKYGADVAAALRAYEMLRVPRVTQVRLNSRQQGKKNHFVLPWRRLRRDIICRIRNVINSQKTELSAGSVYEYDPSRVDLEDALSNVKRPPGIRQCPSSISA
jgi:hypothetical protein